MEWEGVPKGIPRRGGELGPSEAWGTSGRSVACLEDHEQGSGGEADQGAMRVCRGLALPCSCRHMNKYLLPQQAVQLTWGLRSKVRNEWPLSLQLVIGQSPILGPVTPPGTSPGCRRIHWPWVHQGVSGLQSGREPQGFVSARLQTEGPTYSNTSTAHTGKM